MQQTGDISSQKKQIRKMLLERRRLLSESDYSSNNLSISQRLQNLEELNKAKVVHTFVPIPGRHEVDTWPIIRYMMSREIKVVVPVMDFNSIVLRHVYLSDLDDLQANRWGVMEPKHQEEADIREIDIVLVPMVGGDLNGNRIGYGKGYYDSFLQQVKGVKLGLLFEIFLLDSIPVEPHDVRLDALITEKRFIVCDNSY